MRAVTSVAGTFRTYRPGLSKFRYRKNIGLSPALAENYGATWHSSRVTPWAHDMRSKIAVRLFAGAVVDRVQ